MTEIAPTVVTYSAKVPEEPEDAPKSIMEVSMVTYVARPMTASEFEEAMAWIKRSSESVKDTFKKAKKFYDDKNIGGALKAIAGVGNIVSGVMKFLPEEKDPMIENLANLETDVKKLGEKLNENMGEMKLHISDIKFYDAIMKPTSVLTRFMRDCLRSPGEAAKKNFERAYNDTSPLSIQYKLYAYLNQKTTNPLVINMDIQKVKSKSTFEKWEDMISRVMAQFLYLEAFGSGLLKGGEVSKDRLLESSEKVFELLDTWKTEYMKDQNYWGDLKEFFEPFISKATGMSNTEKANRIREKLEDYLTSDAFYFCVFNDVKWNEKYTYWCPNEKDQIIGAWGKGRCNAFVYRSRRATKMGQDDYQKIRNQTLQCADGKLRWTGSLNNIIKNQLIDQSLLGGYGFICLIEARSDPVIFDLNALPPDWLNKGPGHQGSALMDLGNGDRREMKIIVSFNCIFFF
uniref:Endotoxin_N domain-containing protein n=1 Tax=Caenorhabditis tropicalis TaxID=1561998 RepID=A0A1I7V0Q4_9PELO